MHPAANQPATAACYRAACLLLLPPPAAAPPPMQEGKAALLGSGDLGTFSGQPRASGSSCSCTKVFALLAALAVATGGVTAVVLLVKDESKPVAPGQTPEPEPEPEPVPVPVPVLPNVTSCQQLCPQCATLPLDASIASACKCDSCWPGSSLKDTSDKGCDCFAKLGFCKAGEKPVYTPGMECPSCWPPENHACNCFAAIGFCEPPKPLPTWSRCEFNSANGQFPPGDPPKSICPGCNALHCKCPKGACWPGRNITHTPDHTCDCFAKLSFCKAGEKPTYPNPKVRSCPTCWPPENKACMCFASIGFCEAEPKPEPKPEPEPEPAPTPKPDPWPMFMRTASHDASSTTTAAIAAAAPMLAGRLQVAWAYNMSSVVSSSPVLIGNVVLAASGCGPDPCAGGGIVALDRFSGHARWFTSLGSGVAYSSPMPSADQKLVYLGTDAGKVVAISVETGQVLHSYQTGDTVTSTPCVADDGFVFVGSHDNCMYKLNAQLQLVWKFETAGPVWSSPTISDDGTMVFVGSVDKNIYSVHADSGKLAWMHNTTGRIKGSPVYHSDQVLIGSFEEKCMLALNASTGRELWRFTSDDFIFSSPAVVSPASTGFHDVDPMVIVTGTDSFVYGVRLGREVWRVRTGTYIDASPAISGNHVIVASDVLYVIDVVSGVAVSNFSGMASSESSAAIGHDGIYLGSSDGFVRKISSG
jgi:outer membrane protein assembly factor BamB